jgi:hypothetical protein
MAVRLLLVLTLGVAACGGSQLPAWTSAQIGCPAEQIVITKDERAWSTRTWRARCEGKTYACEERHEGEPNVEVSCHELKPSE